MVENRYKVKSLKRYNVQSSGNQPQQAKRFQTFEDLEVYQVAREFRKAMYAVSRRLPDFERFELASQIRRAAVSLTNNIAEGHGRFHYPDQIKSRIEAALPGARLEIIRNDSPSAQHSLLVDNEHALAVARFLRGDPQLRFDYCSNATGIDWPDAVLKEKVKVKKVVDGAEKEVEETVEKKRQGFLEAVYHLYSMELKQGPL